MGALKCDYCGREREDSHIHRVRGGFLYCRDHGDCREYVRRGEFVVLGQKIIDMLAADAGTTAEQIGDVIKESLKRRL